jgi:hypothetical protein
MAGLLARARNACGLGHAGRARETALWKLTSRTVGTTIRRVERTLITCSNCSTAYDFPQKKAIGMGDGRRARRRITRESTKEVTKARPTDRAILHAHSCVVQIARPAENPLRHDAAGLDQRPRQTVMDIGLVQGCLGAESGQCHGYSPFGCGDAGHLIYRTSGRSVPPSELFIANGYTFEKSGLSACQMIPGRTTSLTTAGRIKRRAGRWSTSPVKVKQLPSLRVNASEVTRRSRFGNEKSTQASAAADRPGAADKTVALGTVEGARV